MSSRVFRKLHGEAALQIPGVDGDADISSEEDEVPLPVTSKRFRKKNKHSAPLNPFQVLNDDEENIENDEAEKDDMNDAALSKISTQKDETQTNEPQAPKKKKKKKWKGKSTTADTEKHNTQADEDEIDASIREVNEILGELPSNQNALVFNSDSRVTMEMKALLNVEHKNLNPDTEMKRIFGSRVVQAEQSRRRNTHSRAHLRSTWLAHPKDTWPPYSRQGLSMRLLDSRHGNQYFTFEHNHQYQQVQFSFYDAVESYNPENIAQVLHMYPYHIDALHQLSEVCRMGEDMQMAAELIERALYSFESSFHPSFSLTLGTCRLDYRRPENRAFYLALFRHLLFVGHRGCYRTALEFCKLIFSFDPDGDPLCVLLMIDFYALKSEQYSFLIRMYDEWEANRNLSQLPSMAFSVPLAMYNQAQQDGRDTETADRMLQDSLLMFPGMLIPLLDKCNIVPDERVAAHSFFGTTAQLNQPDALKQLLGLYVGRCHPCWKASEVMAWLETNVTRMLDLVDRNDKRVKDYENKRKGRYQGTPRNIFRHILLSEIKDATAALPPEMANTPVMSYDPLPPTNSITSYTRPQNRNRRVDQENNALTSFFRSLLPNYNPQELAEEDAGAAGGEQPQNIRQSVGALMTAMRDLLSNIQPVAPPVEGQENQENADDQEWD